MKDVKFSASRHFVVAAIVAACIGVFASGCRQQQTDKIETTRYSALGQIMAEKLNETAGGKGRIVLLVSERDDNQPTPFGQAATTFRHFANASFQASVETVATPAMVLSGSEPLSPEKFLALLQKNAAADYLVSFVGIPVLTPAQLEQLPSPRPQIVEVVAYNPPTKAMFAGNMVRLAAVSKGATGPVTERSAQAMFESCYQLVTPQTASLLAR